MIDESDFTGERRRAAFLTLGTLMLVNVMSQLDRQIMSVLVEPIRKDFAFTDTEMGIVVGLATYGYKIMATIGKKITELTPSRGFAAEFGAATTIVLASKLGLPVSTTHTLVGAVIGVGFARGIGAINTKVVSGIIASWFITVPFTAILAAGLFLIGRIWLP